MIEDLRGFKPPIRKKCPECGGMEFEYDDRREDYICTDCGYAIPPWVIEREDRAWVCPDCHDSLLEFDGIRNELRCPVCDFVTQDLVYLMHAELTFTCNECGTKTVQFDRIRAEFACTTCGMVVPFTPQAMIDPSLIVPEEGKPILIEDVPSELQTEFIVRIRRYQMLHQVGIDLDDTED